MAANPKSAPVAKTPEKKEELASRRGLTMQPYFTVPGIHPFNEIEWEFRKAQITNDKGEVIFEQEGVEVPAQWTQLATNVVASKYFKGGLGKPNRETSVKQLIERVTTTIQQWGIKDGYFRTEQDAEVFYNELTYLLVNQRAAFNSPVWFNVGAEPHPQCSACFINSVEDSMSSILELAKTEGMLFKYGSGTGTNLSPLRGSKENLSSGGVASGPVSFMKGFDAFAGVIKSGGKTRRAAKMVILDIDHPDIVDFIECKVKEERKAWALIEMGYDGNFNGEAYSSVFFQNSNNSVRVSDAFMQAVVDGKPWNTIARIDERVMDTFQARDLMKKICEAAYQCGDPGIQFDSKVNEWNPCKTSGRINASNPCSEYMFLDDTACNLSSLNLMKFVLEDGTFDVDAYRSAVRTLIIAMDILVDNSSYPTPKITQNSYDYRPLGLGYANLGALLMSHGLAYDSEEGRAYAAVVTAILCGEAYRTSSELAENIGTFKYYEMNREPFLEVIAKHRAEVKHIDHSLLPEGLFQAAGEVWDEALSLGKDYGYRNAQATVLAPTGTIGFMMDCDTTGVEPDIALVKYKRLAGGGTLKIVNQTVPSALKNLGYSANQVREITRFIKEHETIEGAPGLKDEDLPVFDCAFKPKNGQRTIHYMGHVRMMGAVQPFLSGAISKTVNMPEHSTPDEIAQAYIEAWKLGLKAIAIYRDNSKRSQPLSTSKVETFGKERKPVRRKLPDERHALTHKFSIEGHEGYITVGLYEDGKPGEIFIVMSKEGSTLSGVMDSFATAISLSLQYGVPLEVLVKKFIHARFEPSGWTPNPHIRNAKSIMDYIFRWLALKFLDPKDVELDKTSTDSDPDLKVPKKVKAALAKNSQSHAQASAPAEEDQPTFEMQADAPACATCGAIMVRSGSCYKCFTCGSTSGCS